MKKTHVCEPEQLTIAFSFEEGESIAEAVSVAREKVDADAPIVQNLVAEATTPSPAAVTIAAPVSARKIIQEPEEPADPTLDVFLEMLRARAEDRDLAGLFRMSRRDACTRVSFSYLGYARRWQLDGMSRLVGENEWRRWSENEVYETEVTSKGDIYSFTIPYLFLRQNGNTALVSVKVEMEKSGDLHDGINDIVFDVKTITVRKPVAPKRMYNGVILVQTDHEFEDILSRSKPWVIKWMDENGYRYISYYVEAPWLEILDKAGYAFAGKIMENGYLTKKTRDALNPLCQAGRKPKDIIKTSAAVMEVMKDNRSLAEWNAFRRLDNERSLPKDTLVEIRDRGWGEKQVAIAAKILNLRQNGRAFFTWASLINYLGRLDMYEAIDNNQGLELLLDYLHMCNQLGMEARTDGDSLKREHDIAARLVRNRWQEDHAKAMQAQKEEMERQIAEGNARLARSEYHESIYFVRPVRSYDDLLDEARQQHNCLACYVERIAKGESRIFFMRETARPDRSLVSIELSPDLRTIRQKYLAYNQPIRNKSMSDFIDRWMKQMNSPAENAAPDVALVPAMA